MNVIIPYNDLKDIHNWQCCLSYNNNNTFYIYFSDDNCVIDKIFIDFPSTLKERIEFLQYFKSFETNLLNRCCSHFENTNDYKIISICDSLEKQFSSRYLRLNFVSLIDNEIKFNYEVIY